MLCHFWCIQVRCTVSTHGIITNMIQKLGKKSPTIKNTTFNAQVSSIPIDEAFLVYQYTHHNVKIYKITK